MLRLIKNIKWVRESVDELDHLSYSKHKKSILFAKVCALIAVIGLGQSIHAYYFDLIYVAILDLLLLLIFTGGFYTNYIGKTRFANTLIYISSNIVLFIMSSLLPQHAGVYLYFFPAILLYFVSYDYEERRYSIFFTLFSLLLLFILIRTDFQPFESNSFGSIDGLSTIFAINLFVTIIISSIVIHFIVHTNYTYEQSLVKQREKAEMLIEDIHKKNLSLKKTNEELDGFVYSTSHDLKAPISSITGLLNLVKMEKETIPASIATYLEMITERVNRLNIFIRDILDYSRNSRLEVNLETVNISELIDEVFPTINYLKNADKVEIITEIYSDIVLETDKNRLFRILVNLVSNAIKYCDLEKEKASVTISAQVESTILVIKVEDNGIGISDESKDKIFGMFYRATEIEEGSGLGLYIAHEMTHKLKGTLSFESELGKGSTFSVRIPIG